MLRALALTALLGTACTAPPPPKAETIEHDASPAVVQEAAPTPDNPDEPLQLEPGELLRVRSEGGSCSDHSVLVLRDDGRFSHTAYQGCYIARPGQGPPAPTVEADRLDELELARLHALLADPGLPQMIAIPGGGSGSNHPNRLFFMVRTAAGPVGGEYVGHDMAKSSAFHAFVGALYAKLYP